MSPLLVALVALVVERIWGYPKPLLSAIGHPVMWIGRLIGFCDRALNKPEKNGKARREAGVTAILVVLLAVLIVVVLVLSITLKMPFGWLVEGVLASSLLAQKELGRAVAAVADGLDVSLAQGRREVGHIVGRDPEALDQAGVSRAAVETLAENASDGVIAPLFWLALLGLPGIALYKAINTADSMIGHLNARYADFGRASARLDDLVNWVPARLCGGLFVLACLLVPKASAVGAWKAMRQDARKHASPNAGWPEAAMAGALGFALGGPRSYEGQVVDLPKMGNGRAGLGPEDIRRALGLYRSMLNVTAIVLGLLVLWRI